MRIPGILFFCVALFCITSAHGQSGHLRFRHYKTNDGLSQADVFHIYRDSKGFMWFSTYDGLNRFDGYQFRVFRPVNTDSNHIKGERINGVLEDRSGNIWAGTNEALNVYYPGSGIFRQHYIEQPDGKPFRCSYDPVYIDDQQELWFVYNNRSLGSFNLQTGTLTDHPFADGLMSEFTTAEISKTHLYQPVHYLYAAGSHGLHEIDLQKKSVNYYFSAHKQNQTGNRRSLRRVLPGEDRVIWLSGRDGLIRLHLDRREYKLYNTGPEGSRLAELSALAKDRNGLIWCGTYGQGLLVFNPADEIFAHQFIRDVAQPETISNNAVTSLYCDRDDNLWIGIDLEGVDKVNPSYEQLEHARVYPSGEKETYTGSVWAIAELNRDELVICSNHQDVFRFSIRKDQSEKIVLPVSFQGTTIFNLLSDSGGRVWIAGEKGLLLSEDGMKSFRQVYSGDFRPDVQLCWNNGRLYAGTGNGLFSFYLNGREVLTDTVNPLLGHHIMAIAAGYNGKIYAATSGKSVWETDPVSGYASVFSNADFMVKSILYDRPDTMWLGTTTGLVMIHAMNKRVQVYSEDDGLPNHYIYSLIRGNDGLIWMSTNKGISAFNPADRSFNNFGLQEGVQSLEFNTHAAAAGRDGRLYFGGVKGFNFFRPSGIRTFSFEPRLVLLDAEVNGEHLALNIFNQPQPVVFGSDQNNLQVEFAAIDYNRNNHIIYSYRFGENENWISIGARRTLSFVNLQPGNYKLTIRAQLSASQVSPHLLYMHFSIRPPLYKRTWFLFLAGLICVAAVYGFYLYRIRNFLRMQAMRNRIAQDLHDEIGATLSGISMYTHLSSSQLNAGKTDAASASLQVIQEHASDMVTKLNEIVWLVNPEQDGFPRLVQRLEEYALDMAAPQHTRIVVHAPADLDQLQLQVEHRRHLYLICKEAIHNAVKYAEASEIELAFMQDGQSLLVSVRDNGKGFDEALITRGNGLTNMRRRAEQLKTALITETAPGKGCRISLRLKIT